MNYYYVYPSYAGTGREVMDFIEWFGALGYE
jgi:hypothetical protein